MQNQFPPSLAVKVFNNEFLQKLDETCKVIDEDEAVKHKEALCSLNKMVCSYYPQWGIPWFHEEFCKKRAKAR